MILFAVWSKIPKHANSVIRARSWYIFRDERRFNINPVIPKTWKVNYTANLIIISTHINLCIWLNSKLKRTGKINILRKYVRRYLRLTPLSALVILFSMSLQRFFGSGPLWYSTPVLASGACGPYWWSTLLHIQNYFNSGMMVKKKTDFNIYQVTPKK